MGISLTIALLSYITAALPSSLASADPRVTVLQAPLSATRPNTLYVSGRAPLAPLPLVALPPGSVRAEGWLLAQLERQADGLTRQLPELDRDVGPDSAWLGGGGESWERGPYYVRGLVALAYVLGDPTLIAQARPWIEWVLASQDADGYFGPAARKYHYDWWPNMIVLDCLREYHEATGDERVLPFLLRYFAYQQTQLEAHPFREWAEWRAGENLACVYWLYDRTGETWLLELGERVFERGTNVTAHALDTRRFGEGFHVVNHAMTIKQPGVYYRRSRDRIHLEAVEAHYRKTMAFQGRIDGMFSGDELLRDKRPDRGTEFCAIVEYLYSHQTLLQITGAAIWADRMERAAFNALPAITTPDLRGFQYYTQQNQVLCSLGPHGFRNDHGDDLTFGPLTGYPCCRFNWHFGWPRLVRHLWLATADNGLAVSAYGPCAVTARVADGVSVTVREETGYPFHDGVRLAVAPARPAAFPLVLRVPGWCEGASLRVNGATAETTLPAGGWVRIDRTWSATDTVELRLPMAVHVRPWDGGAVAVERGPLVFASRIEETWSPIPGKSPQAFPSYEVRPAEPWNVGLVLDATDPSASFRVETRAVPAQPWDAKQAPVLVHGRGKRILSWGLDGGNAAAPPQGPVRSAEPARPIVLVPYGATAVRIALFPVVD